MATTDHTKDYKEDILRDIENSASTEELHAKILLRYQNAKNRVEQTALKTENPVRYIELNARAYTLEKVLEDLQQYFESCPTKTKEEDVEEQLTISNAETLKKLKQTLDTLVRNKLDDVNFEVRMSQDFYEYCKDKEVDFGEINVFFNPCQPEPYIIIKMEEL